MSASQLPPLAANPTGQSLPVLVAVSPPGRLVSVDSAVHPTRAAAETAVRAVALAQPWRAGLALDAELHTVLPGLPNPEPGQPAPPTDTAATRRARGLLLAEAAVLRTLRYRNDSLLRTLEETPLPTFPAVAGLAVDSGATRPAGALPPVRAWAISIGGELTRGWGSLPAIDPTATEKLQTGLTYSVNVARQLTDRWRLRAGLGQTVVRTQLSYQQEIAGETVHLDTTRTTALQVHESTDTTYIIRIVQELHLEPRLNNIGQLIGYDSSYVAIRDTTFQVVNSTDTLRTTQVLVTRRIDAWRESRAQTLRPEYRFWTVPVAGQFALLTQGRLRLGLSAGAQVLIFRDGARPVRRAAGYALERVGPRNGPFRPVSLAWQASADVEWRFGPRLSATVAPGLRG